MSGETSTTSTTTTPDPLKFGKAVAKLRTQRDSLKTERDSLAARVAELEKRPAVQDLEAKLAEAQGKLRETTHRAAFEKVAAKAGLNPKAIADAWSLSGYKPEADEPDESKLAAAIEGLKSSGRDYLFAEAAAGDQGQGQQARSQERLARGADGSRGRSGDNSGKLRVTPEQRSDPSWMKSNQAALAEAAKAGTLEFLG